MSKNNNINKQDNKQIEENDDNQQIYLSNESTF